MNRAAAHLRDLAVTIGTAVAPRLVEARLDPGLVVETKSTSTDLVTEMDRWAEREIVERLLSQRPDDGLIGEEGADQQGSSGIVWYIDPIDGTTNYVYGHPGYSVSIAAADGDTVIAGAVVDPVAGQVFAAATGDRSTCNGVSIAHSGKADLATALLATGFGYLPDRRKRQAAVVTEIIGSVRDIRRMGGAAVDLCSVACGRVDAYYEVGLSPWDSAAGGFIAQQAGAIVTDGAGNTSILGAQIAAPPTLHGQLLELLQTAGAFEV